MRGPDDIARSGVPSEQMEQIACRPWRAREECAQMSQKLIRLHYDQQIIDYTCFGGIEGLDSVGPADRASIGGSRVS